MTVKIKKLHPEAKTPTYATPGSACFDLYATTVDGMKTIGSHVYAESPITCGTGLAFEVPEGHVMLVFSRSGHGFSHGVRLANCVGVIDSDYRGELMVKLTCDEDEEEKPPLFVKPGDRVAQAMILPVERVAFEVVDELSGTERGSGGLGSTGQ